MEISKTIFICNFINNMNEKYSIYKFYNLEK